MTPQHRHAKSARLPSGLQGPSPSAHDPRGRPTPVLPGVDGRSRDVQPVLLVPRRPADVWGALRVRPVGDVARPRHAQHPAGVVPCASSLRSRQASAHGSWRCSRVEDRANSARLPRSRSRERAACRLGLRGRRHVHHQGRARGRGLPAARPRRGRPDACATPGRDPSDGSGPQAARRALPGLPVPGQTTRRPLRDAPVLGARGAGGAGAADGLL